MIQKENKTLNVLPVIIGFTLVFTSLFYSLYVLKELLQAYLLDRFTFAYIKYYFVKIFPIIIFAPYYLLKNFNPGKNTKITQILKYVSKGIVASAIILTIVVVYNNVILNIPLKVNFDLKWTYRTIYEWLFNFFTGYLLFIQKTKDSYMSLNFAIQSIVSGATIYEFPVVSSIWVYFHNHNPFFVHTPLISIIFLIHILRSYSWKPNRLFYFASAFYIVFSIFYYFLPHGFPSWIPRLPTIFLMLTLPTGIKETVYQYGK